VTPPLILLASASPRRSELLRQIGVAHAVRPVDVDESVRPGETPSEYVVRLAQSKAAALWHGLARAERLPVLAADTTVAFEGEIFGKPMDLHEARAMLGRLSGRTHEVHTAVAVRHAGGATARLSSSSVSLREITSEEIDAYWATGEPADKAGGYAVQGRAAVFIRHIAGSYSGIMGLPLFETWELLGPLLGQTKGSSA
jgi:septum formation protein